VTLAPDVREYFPDSESVNAALRSLIGLIPKKRGTVAKRTPDDQGRSLSEPVTGHATTRHQIRFRLRTARFIHE
jgi:hypothetical protein